MMKVYEVVYFDEEGNTWSKMIKAASANEACEKIESLGYGEAIEAEFIDFADAI